MRNAVHRVLYLFLGVIRYERFHSQIFQALVQAKNRLDYPARSQVRGVSQVNDFRQGNMPSKALERFPGIRTVGEIRFFITGKINPALLIVTVDIGVVRSTCPKPAELFLMKPKLCR